MKKVPFFVDERHSWLADSEARLGEANIGTDGRNLTVVFLSYNRISLSKRLINSFKAHAPHFAGRFLIVDNGSDEGELSSLRSFMRDECPFAYDILEMGENFGVAGGRNRGFRKVKTDWIMSLDNDIYLVANPFPQIKSDLSLLGTHFLSVPLINPDHQTLYSFGANLDAQMVHGRQPFLGIRCAIAPGSNLDSISEFAPTGEGFLCSFMFGGACVFKRDSHDVIGELDENMRVGFEDIEFSLRAYRKGFKVGASCVAAFVHDHPRAEISVDQDYERQRYSRLALQSSAEYFERKHGIQVWSESVEQWLRDREVDQGIADAANGGSNFVHAAARKPHIALIVDSPTWAYANIAHQIARHLSDEFSFEIISTWTLSEIDRVQSLEAGVVDALPIERSEALARIMLRSPEFDLIHVFWRASLTVLEPPRAHELRPYLERIGLSDDEFKSIFVNGARITTSVYDHLFLEDEMSRALIATLNSRTISYTVSSERLGRIYENHVDFRSPSAVIPDGVDRKIFFPKNLARLRGVADRELVVGWFGNSLWGGERDVKGVRTILEPALAELRAEGVRVRGEFSDRQRRHIPHHQMIDYYASIDVLVCVSEIEGTPNPVLEAMACGVPIISTDVGIVPEAFGDQQYQFILSNRSIGSLKNAICTILEDPAILLELSRENLHAVERWTWDIQARKFAAFFKSAMERSSTRS